MGRKKYRGIEEGLKFVGGRTREVRSSGVF